MTKSHFREADNSRHRTVSDKIDLGIAPIYLHRLFDAEGRLCEVAVSTPGRHADSHIDDALQAIAQLVTAALTSPLKG